MSRPVPARRADALAADKSVTGFPPRWLLWLLALLLTTGVMAAIAGDQAPAVFQTYIYAIFTLPIFLSAGMLGMLLTAPFAARHTFDHAPQPNAFRALIAIALGLGAFAMATLLFGTLHLLEPHGNPYPLLAIPLLAAITGFPATRKFLGSLDRSFFTGRAHRGDWLFLLAAVPAAMLLISVTFPPGSLWHTEGNAYDVLEYHLQLPREYALNNSTAPFHHNVFSYFPQNIEMLYLLLMQFAKAAMGGDRDTGYIWATFPAQFCHATLTLLTAAALALMPVGAFSKDKHWLLATGRAIAVLLFLGTPWTIITGSLAYNESGMLFFGTLALGLALSSPNPGIAIHGPTPSTNVHAPIHTHLLIGLLLGLAVGCKLTAAPFFALPIAAIYLLRAATNTSHLRHLAIVTLLALSVFSPWAIRSALSTGGNPVFPLATSLLPRSDWTSAQAQRFDRGVSAPAALRPLSARLQTLANKSFFDPQWSVQPYVLLHITDDKPPVPDTPPQKHLGLLWLAIPLALACAFITKNGRSESALLLVVLIIQLLAWLFATQLESRFLLPTAIPLALLAGRGVQGFHIAAEGTLIGALRLITGTIIGLHALGTIFLLLPEASLFAGIRPQHNRPPAPSPIGEVTFGMNNITAAAEDPEGKNPNLPLANVLLLGDAKAYLFLGPVTYFTVFDTNPILNTIDNPQALLAYLQQKQIRYVYVDWLELARLKDTYGLDLEAPPHLPTQTFMDRATQLETLLTPKLLAVHLQEIPSAKSPTHTLFRVPQNP